MKHSIYPCLWFDGQAKAAADFYCSIFKNSKITSDNPMVVNFELEGKKVMGLNGGPMYKINPAISFFVTCTSNEEIELTWKKLSDGGSAMMALDKYPWSEKYGWVKDKFGMTWQLMLGEIPKGMPKINPSFLFSNKQFGKAVEAIKFYTSVFPNSKSHELQLYGKDAPQGEGNLMFGHFNLGGETFSAMDGPGNHEFDFNEGFSLIVSCDTQEEINRYWDVLTKDGGKESMCGWLKDRFGVSWQIIPSNLGKLMSDPQKGQKVVEAFLKMKKFDIKTLENV